MILEDDIRDRLEDSDPKVFVQAYQELCGSVAVARKKLRDTAIYSGLEKTLEQYTPRYIQIKSPPPTK